MLKKLIFLFLTFSVVLSLQEASGQSVDSTSFKIFTRLSFYTFEKNGELLLHVPKGVVQKNLSIDINVNNETISSWNGNAQKNILRLPFPVALATGSYKITASITVSSNRNIRYLATTDLDILSYKSNEVKSDRLTGGLIVNKRPFFPFGFYTYSPVMLTLPEEEVVKGFNMISPYQKILPETLGERKAYMDRCARLGMKVHYNLLSVSGGGGVGSKIEGISETEKRSRMIEEIKTFMNHPALLAWYISDEPNGYSIPPDTLEGIYRLVREVDPWHPVSMVFSAPFLSSAKYAEALDIVMADPYPLPDLPVSFVGKVTGQLKDEFRGRRPVWIVPQAFGGGELWSREPTIQEIRSMTWQAIIKGATGIQYFVRQGLNYFPKSAATWGECGRIAMEVAELVPWLLSDEETLPIESYSGNIAVSSRLHNGQLIVMAVNMTNAPLASSLRIKGVSGTRAIVLFENRTVSVNDGVISDQLAPYGSQVYLINIKPEQTSMSTGANLTVDAGFEDLSSPGIPSACYARPGGDPGATFFTDSREHYKGNHSLRILTPENNKSVALRFFPVKVKAGATYTISLWAKSDPEQRIQTAIENGVTINKTGRPVPQYVEIELGELGRARFIPDKEWREYVTFITIPTDTLASFKTNLMLRMPGQGVAWFDEVKVMEDLVIKR
jgi:hypothetical protein